jgi:hypothetical protein
MEREKEALHLGNLQSFRRNFRLAGPSESLRSKQLSGETLQLLLVLLAASGP